MAVVKMLGKTSILLSVLLLIQVILVVVIGCTVPNEDHVYILNGGFMVDDGLYGHLADSLISGRCWLDLNVPTWLADADNPYDTSWRGVMGAQTGEYSYWDYAFYDGKYYSYFGVLPAIVLFVPFKILTGTTLQTGAAVVLLGVGATVALFALIRALYARWAPQAGVIMVGLSFLLLVQAAAIPYLVYCSMTYSIPILSAQICAFLGLTFWMKARCVSEDGSVRIKSGSMLVGSTLIACTLACRPTFVLVALLGFPLFWDEIRKTRILFSKTSIRVTSFIFLPFVVIGGLAMVYNAIRFGSPFDFGSNYNLTGFDMPAHTTSKATVAFSIFEYLLQPPDLTMSFPYLRVLDQGVLSESWGSAAALAIMEPYYGGIVFFAPICFLLIVVPFRIKKLRARRMLMVTVFLILLGIAILLIDSQIAITMRYWGDFGWLFALAALCTVLSFYGESTRRDRMIKVLLAACLVCGAAMWSFNLFSPERYYPMVDVCPQVYEQVAGFFTA